MAADETLEVVAERDGMANGTRSDACYGEVETVGRLLRGMGGRHAGWIFRLMAADETLEVVAERRDGIANGTRGLACYGSCGLRHDC